MAFGVADFERRAAVVAEIELGKVAVQVSLAAMLVDADHAVLEDGRTRLNRVGVDDGRPEVSFTSTPTFTIVIIKTVAECFVGRFAPVGPAACPQIAAELDASRNE